MRRSMLRAQPTLTVNETARAAGATPETVRYYTRIGLLRPARNVRNAYRLYDQHDVARLRFIRRAKMLGFTLRDIRAIFAAADAGDSPCPLVRNLIAKRFEETREELEAALALHRRMEDALQRWQTLPDRAPTGRSICHLIESTVPDSALTIGRPPPLARHGP